MNSPRLQITEGMRRFLDYPKFRGPSRMLVLCTDYFFDKSWQRAAESLGWACATVRSAMVGGLTRDDIQALFTTIGEFKPDFILTSNYAGMDVEGMFARFFEDARIPYVSWFTDTPRMILYGRKMHVSPWSVAATWERAYIPHFEALGFEAIHFMPLATDPVLFSGAPADSFARPLAFVGTSMIGETREALEKHADLPWLLDVIEAVFNEGRVTRARFAEGMDALLGAENMARLDATQRRNAELLVIYEATLRQRVSMVQALAALGIEVRGDGHWREAAANVGGAVGYYDGLAPFYRSTAINLNSTSVQMRYAVNQRVFDCPAAGGFLLTDAQDDLRELFAEEEVATYAGVEELEDRVRFFAARPDLRARIVTRAQQRIAGEHTHAHRLRGLEAFLKARFA